MIFMRPESIEFSQRCRSFKKPERAARFQVIQSNSADVSMLRDCIEPCAKMSTQPTRSLSVIKIFSKKVFWQPFSNEVIVQ